jgi:hypothetical protein
MKINEDKLTINFLLDKDDFEKVIDELVRCGFTKQQVLKAYQCLCNLS